MSRYIQKRALNFSLVQESAQGYPVSNDPRDFVDSTYAYLGDGQICEAITGQVRCELSLEKMRSHMNGEWFELVMDAETKRDIIDTTTQYVREQLEHILNHVPESVEGEEEREIGTTLIMEAGWKEQRSARIQSRNIRPRDDHFSSRSQYRAIPRGRNVHHPIMGLDFGNNNGAPALRTGDPRHPTNPYAESISQTSPFLVDFDLNREAWTMRARDHAREQERAHTLEQQTIVNIRAMTEQERRNLLSELREGAGGTLMHVSELGSAETIRTLTPSSGRRSHSTERSRRIARSHDDDG